uniref:uncharacterized protein LOC122607687 n=1 Tax=Erigeron canadensis TaxID=72917 RepID=UPI001CB99AE2|nr:uncharacterized protein LOC122607687 [Erigeron canadensis]
MDLDSVLGKSSSRAAIEEEKHKKGRCDRFGTKMTDSTKLKEMALNSYSQLTKSEQVSCILAACSTVYTQELQFSWSAEKFLPEGDIEAAKTLALKMAKIIGEDASALHARIEKPKVKPCILNDKIRYQMLDRYEDFLKRMEEVKMHQRKLKLKNKSDDQGASSVTKGDQSDGQYRKEMLAKKATEKGFPDFVW